MTNKFVHHVTKAPIPAISMSAVESSQIKQTGYDPATQTLAVSFTRGTGAIYHYPGVTPEAHAAFVGAESIGKHFGQHIRLLPFSKFAPDPAPEAVAA